ncbi:MAG TPA: hypothetical protein VHB21_18430 [Minicystis sp.]|nr:hypothetical protein [Minicystis sp.]
MKRLLGSLAALSLGLAAAGCNTDPAVFVEPSIQDPKADVAGGLLGVELSGSFVLALPRGARAADASQVSLGDFEVVTPKDESPIDPKPLPVEGDKTFPLTVAQDSDVVVHFTFDTGKEPLPPSTKGGLCAPGGVVLKGTITDSLASSATPFVSDPFDPSGC